MPELPEVETVRRGLLPYVVGARIGQVTLNRADLRFPFPAGLSERLKGRTIEALDRRAKYLLFALSDGQVLLSHLGMTGSWRFADRKPDEPTRYHQPAQGHDHLVMEIDHPEHGTLEMIYADPRRFGFIDLIAAGGTSAYLAGLGPEPLGNALSAEGLAEAFKDRKTPIKAALLDQRRIAGLGNIYVCEALWRAGIAPTALAGSLVTARGRATARLDALTRAIRDVLDDAIAAGGSTLRDFRAADGTSGYFQHSFSVYDREGEPCLRAECKGTVARIVQSGRSSFFCPVCQR
jgi:formamidopyrimidine-DNA glycosylase